MGSLPPIFVTPSKKPRHDPTPDMTQHMKLFTRRLLLNSIKELSRGRQYDASPKCCGLILSHAINRAGDMLDIEKSKPAGTNMEDVTQRFAESTMAVWWLWTDWTSSDVNIEQLFLHICETHSRLVAQLNGSIGDRAILVLEDAIQDVVDYKKKYVDRILNFDKVPLCQGVLVDKELLKQAEVFSRFTQGDGTDAAAGSGSGRGKGKGKAKSSGRGKAGRMTEEEEDARMMKANATASRATRLTVQPTCIKFGTMRAYQVCY